MNSYITWPYHYCRITWVYYKNGRPHVRPYSLLQRRGTPVLLSASLSNNSGNSPQMAVPRRLCEIDQSTQRFHVGCDN